MMARSDDDQVKYIESSDFVTFLKSQGVEFLLSSNGKIPLSSCVDRTICLFFSANWCRPCKKFIPQLVQVYQTLRARGKDLEIVFVSFDQEQDGFDEHFKCMPWLAVPFDGELHRRLSKKYRVDRIPSITPLILEEMSVEEDVIGLIEDYGPEAYPFNRKRIQELKSIDDSKRRGGKLEDLLTLEDRNYVLSKDLGKVLVTDLIGKTIGLYFAAQWSPPCRSFTQQLIDTYNVLRNEEFEIVLVSTDRDQKEFEVNRSSMPWLALPYEDRTRQDLCRIFNIKGIPALVLIGPEGRTISTNGKEMVSMYGAKAFPFTETRIAEVESSLRKEGEALPHEVKDIKHEHELKLDMAKAYVCDYCKKQGRFWTFSCDVCNYDLHPSCVEEES